MYKILVGIPAMGLTNNMHLNEKGLIVDQTFEDNEDLWCDFAVEKHDGFYAIGFETMLLFDKEDGCKNWIKECFTVFTEYMNEHSYDTNKVLNMYEVFTTGVNVNTKFETIEDAYAFVKFCVNGFEGDGI